MSELGAKAGTVFLILNKRQRCSVASKPFQGMMNIFVMRKTPLRQLVTSKRVPDVKSRDFLGRP